MNTKKSILTGLILSVLNAGSFAGSEESHPLFSKYPKASLFKAQMIDYETFSFPLSLVETNKKLGFVSLNVTGVLFQHFYEIENVSSLKVSENYREAAKQLGFDKLFSCDLGNCGGKPQVEALGSIISVTDDVYNYWRKPYYWVGEKESPKGKIVVAWYVGSYDDEVAVMQVLVEEEPLETGLIQVDPAYIKRDSTPNKVEPLDEREKAKDHPMLPRYPGARLRTHRKVDTESVTLPMARNTKARDSLSLTGDLAKHTYEIYNVSTLKVYENYKSALSKAGFDFISRCELDACGNKQQVQDLGGRVADSGDVYNSYRKPYYLLAKKADAGGNIFVALFIGGYDDEVGLQQIVVKERQVQTGLVEVDPEQLKQQIEAEGKALIYGIYFDTGKAEIQPESETALKAIAELLSRNSDLLLYVVGHTDDTGDGSSNLVLSRERAKSVVTALVNDYQISADRLEAQGVGPYAPAANNTTHEGKQKNRRVELVKRLE